jgi:large subunit ribosomal protein L1
VGTVTFDVAEAVREQKAGKIEFRVEKSGILHAPLGKASFQLDQLAENLLAVTEAVLRAKPVVAKGSYLKRVSISTTMGPSIRLDTADLQASLQ